MKKKQNMAKLATSLSTTLKTRGRKLSEDGFNKKTQRVNTIMGEAAMVLGYNNYRTLSIKPLKPVTQSTVRRYINGTKAGATYKIPADFKLFIQSF